MKHRRGTEDFSACALHLCRENTRSGIRCLGLVSKWINWLKTETERDVHVMHFTLYQTKPVSARQGIPAGAPYATVSVGDQDEGVWEGSFAETDIDKKEPPIFHGGRNEASPVGSAARRVLLGLRRRQCSAGRG